MHLDACGRIMSCKKKIMKKIKCKYIKNNNKETSIRLSHSIMGVGSTGRKYEPKSNHFDFLNIKRVNRLFQHADENICKTLIFPP